MSSVTHIELLDSDKLDSYLKTGDPAFDKVVSAVSDEIKAFRGKAKRWHSPGYDQHLKLILLNLYNAYLKNPKWYVAYDRNKNRYSTLVRYTGAALSHGTMVNLIDDLETLGYCEDVRGIYFPTAKYTSRMRATSKLMTLLNHELAGATVEITEAQERETIILKKGKDEDKKLLDYDESAETIQMRMNLRKINEVNDTHFVGLHVLDDVLHDMILEMVDEKQRVALKSNFEMAKLHLDMTSTQLKRIFNNSTFKQGGRYYGGWWQRIPRNYRKYILIDDQMTVEIDYSAFHPQLLYMIKKLEPPLGDAYSLPGIPEKARLLIKKTFNILVNATSEESALKAIRKLRRDGDVPKPPKGLTDKLIIDAIRVKHSALDEFFCSGYGTKLQRIDSDIAEQVMLELVQKVIAVLPIHDSFIVRHDHRHALEQAMQNAVIGIFGRGIASKVDVTAWQEIIELGIEEELGGFKGFESTKPSGCDEYYAQMKRWEKMNGRCSTTESPPESIKTLSWGKWRMN